MVIVRDGDASEYYVSQSVAEKVARLCDTSVSARRGRPKATEKSLADFVCEGADARAVRRDILLRLMRGDCTAGEVAQLERELVDAGRLTGPVPYKVLRELFGGMLTCSRASLNRHERGLQLR